MLLPARVPTLPFSRQPAMPSRLTASAYDSRSAAGRQAGKGAGHEGEGALAAIGSWAGCS